MTKPALFSHRGLFNAFVFIVEQELMIENTIV